MGCLVEDDLLEATHAGRLLQTPAIEAHLAGCAACSAVVAALVAGERDTREAWGALAGRRLGPYRLDLQIGAGAMGDVYRGHDERLDRPVAVKILTSPDQLGDRAAAAIVHPNVVTVHDVGSADGRTFVVSELVNGESLRSVLSSGRMPHDQALRLAVELARGLAAAHAAGVVHRDLKPENLLVAAGGSLKILDFGLAKRTGDAGQVDDTEPGAVRGTVGYMAPEQARGEPVDARADLFAAGAILYELFTGVRAFPGGSHADRLSAVLRDTPPGLDDLGPIGPVIARCLSKDPEARFHSAHDLAWVLERIGAPGSAAPAPGPSRRGLLIGGAAAAGAGVIGILLGRVGRERAPTPLRQLTFRQGRVVTARFSRDGHGIFFGAAWDDEPLAASSLRIDGGVPRVLELPPADVLAVSASQLAVGLDRRHVDGHCATGRLALVPIDGGVPRVMRDEVQDADLSADGSELALVARIDGGFQLEWPLGRVMFSTDGWLSHPRISPDRRRVACLLHPGPDDDQGQVAVFARDGAGPQILSRGWSSASGLAWNQSSDRIWVSGGREGNNSVLHAIDLDGGHRQRYEAEGRLRLHDLDGGGRLLVSREAWRVRTMTGGGGEPDADRSLTNISVVADMSPDGRSLMVGELGEVDAVNGVYLVPVAGGERLRLGPGMPIARSPDQSLVLVSTFARAEHRPRPVLYAAAGGGATPLGVEPVEQLRWACWIDDDQLVIGGSAAGRPPRLWRVSRNGDTAEPLTDEGVHGRGALEGRRVAFIGSDHRLMLVDVEGGTPSVVQGGFRDHVVCGWNQGKILVRTACCPIDIRRIDPATGASTPFRQLTPPPLGRKGVDAVALDATGDRYAYSYGQELSQLFLLEL